MKRKLAIVGFVVLIVVISATAFVRDRRPVLIRMPFGLNQETGDHNYVLFNPFRDRSPERAAAEYLEAMRRGDCEDAQKRSANLELPNGLTCEHLQHESRNYRDLFVQPLRDRNESRGDVVLYYSNCRCGVEGNWIAVRRWGDGWRVVGFNKIW